MKILSLETFDDIVNFWKSRDYTISFIRTTGGIHDGHLGLIRMVQEKCDRVVLLFSYHLPYIGYPQMGKYEDSFENDKKKLEGAVRYIIVVPYNAEVEALYCEHKERCKNYNWDQFGIKLAPDATFIQRFIAATTPLPIEKTLWKFDFPALSEKDAFHVIVANKISQETYDDKTPRQMYFPVIRHNGVCIDSRDMMSKDMEDKVRLAPVIRDIRSLICEDLNGEEILKKVGYCNDDHSIRIMFWSTKDVKRVDRPSECKAERFLTSKGEFDCNILNIAYSSGGVGYSECSFFDSVGRFVLDETSI